MHHHAIEQHQETAAFVLPASWAQCRQSMKSSSGVAIDREFSHLNEDFQKRLLEVLAGLQKQGYTPILLEGYRTPERQESLFLEGNKALTNASSCSSYHQLGRAVDIGFFRNGKISQDMKDPWIKQAYDSYGQLAQEHGLKWGASWHDYAHVELPLSGPEPIFKRIKKTDLEAARAFVWGVGQMRSCTNSSFTLFNTLKTQEG